MKNTHLLSLVGLAVALVAPLQAQVALNDFSSFADPATTYFTGSWSVGDDVTPLASFAQTASGYSLVGAPAGDTGYVTHYFASTLDLSGYTSLSLTAQLQSGNTASTLTISLIDSDTNVSSAVFALSDFNLTSGASATAAFTPSGSFAASSVMGFRITAAGLADSSSLAVTLSSAAAVTASAVPEPSTYAAICGAVVLVGAVVLRRRRGTA